MSRYIDEEKTDSVIKNELGVYDTTDLKEMLKFFPAEDVAPVVHAHWINYNGEHVELDSNGSPKDSCWCSHCHEWLVTSDEYTIVNRYCGRYCPNCGAKMDEEIKE